jgi:hypothetical protein
VQACPFLLVQTVAASGKDLVNRKKLYFLALGKVGGLVQHEPAVVNVGLERLHRS